MNINSNELPLLPIKKELCNDVRPVLRNVFRDRDFLPPLTKEMTKLQENSVETAFVENNSTLACNLTEDYIKIYEKEKKLKVEYAKKLSRTPLSNIYKLYSSRSSSKLEWKVENGLIDRRDLKPTVVQNSGRNESLWIKNILNRSSSNVLSTLKIHGTKLTQPETLKSTCEISYQSLRHMSVGGGDHFNTSIGEAVPQSPLPLPALPTPPEPKDCIACIPAELKFVNFVVGQTHMLAVRLVNVTKQKMCMSIRLPQRRELNLELPVSSGLKLTSGASSEIKVYFKPTDVRPFTDVMEIRVLNGRTISIPIFCYIEPPILEVLVLNNYSNDCCLKDMESEKAIETNVIDLGAKLTGDVHSVKLKWICKQRHATFFLLGEESWLNFNIDGITNEGSLIVEPFVINPVYWEGGGVVPSQVWCQTAVTGIQHAALRILVSTAIIRSLDLIADALHFSYDHITIEAHEKNFDIDSEADSACPYFVNLGISFPGRKLEENIRLINHSPITYTYYWIPRLWRSCYYQPKESNHDEVFDINEMELKNKPENAVSCENETNSLENEILKSQIPSVSPPHGVMSPRSENNIQVLNLDVGTRLGVQKSVLMLILKDVPKLSFPKDFEPWILSSKIIEKENAPGLKPWSVEVCDVVYTQLEVWWEVAPIRFCINPPLVVFPHSSRRKKNTNICLTITQLCGVDPVCAQWELPSEMRQQSLIPVPELKPSQTSTVHFTIPLFDKPDSRQYTKEIILKSKGSEWRSKCYIKQSCDTRQPALHPNLIWLGNINPTSKVSTSIEICNQTHQQIFWRCLWWPLLGHSNSRKVCEGRDPCVICYDQACTCDTLIPSKGFLQQEQSDTCDYCVIAPKNDGCGLALVQLKRTNKENGKIEGAASTSGRAALIGYRVLAPVLLLSATSELGKVDDVSGGKFYKTAVLRPTQTLQVNGTTSYKMLFTNTTPNSTKVTWEQPLDKENILKVNFKPNEFEIKGFETVFFQVNLEALKVCGRQIYIFKATVENAYTPTYLLIDAKITGLEVIIEVPTGCLTKSFISIRRQQIEECKLQDDDFTSAEKIFEYNDKKRAFVEENICFCHTHMVYIPPTKNLWIRYPQIDIVTTPPELTRVCSCLKPNNEKPQMPMIEDPPCLQFKGLLINTVQYHTVSIKNISDASSKWEAFVRRWPRKYTRSVKSDSWTGGVHDVGVAIDVKQSQGVIRAYEKIKIEIYVYADSWGLFMDQLLIKIDNLEPLIVDIWIEAVGPPLYFYIKPSGSYSQDLPITWLSRSDPKRKLRVKNTSRTDVVVNTFTLIENEHTQDWLPFRVYIRFIDRIAERCRCASQSETVMDESSKKSSSTSELSEMETSIELYLSPDYGKQDNTYFKLDMEENRISAGQCAEWIVTLDPPDPDGEWAPPACILLRILPVSQMGDFWYRPEPYPMVVRLQQANQSGHLSASCEILRVKMCALDLPDKDILRIRKRLRLINSGDGPLDVFADCEEPWFLVLDENHADCGSGCPCVLPRGTRENTTTHNLKPKSSTEICVEVRIHSSSVYPTIRDDDKNPQYPMTTIQTNKLYLSDKYNTLLVIPLELTINFPKLYLEPLSFDFGFVKDGDTRKTYFTVSHSSETALDVMIIWNGCRDFRLSPTRLHLISKSTQRVYLQYTAKWLEGQRAEGLLRVMAAKGGGADDWCRASASVRALPAADNRCHQSPHDHTDDDRLLPPLSYMPNH